MRQAIIRSALFLVILVLFFIADICGFFWYQNQILYLLFSFLIVAYWYHFNLFIFIVGIPLLAAEALVINQGHFILFFIQLGILVLLILGRQRLYLNGIIPLLAFIVYGAAVYPIRPYTTITLFVNLIVIGIFSLKLKTSKTRQSLTPIA